MTIRALPALPTDYGRNATDHYALANAMRETDDWVHAGDYANRRTALNIASKIRNGVMPAYRAHRYDARAITNSKGVHEVWGQYVGERTR